MTKMSNFLVPIALLLSLIPSCTAGALNWGLYRWIQNEKSLYEPLTPKQLHLSHPMVPYLGVVVWTAGQLRQDYNSYNGSVYGVGGGGSVRLIAEGPVLRIGVEGVDQFGVEIRCQKEQCRQAQKIMKQSLQQQQEATKHCKSQKNPYQYECNPKNTSLTLTITHIPSQLIPLPSHSQIFDTHKQQLHSFMTRYNITSDPLKQQIIQYSLSSLVSSVCMYYNQWDGQFYMGFCDQGRNRKWGYNYKLAPFSIYLLADYHYQLAKHVYDDYFAMLESRLMYPMTYEGEVLPLPEHVEVLTRFGNVLELQDEAELLNSLFVIPMLNQLGTLHQQLNYRQAKKFHPLLLKMLQQKWSPSSPKHSLKSVYQQSFTQDFPYHNYGQQLEQSPTKIAWLYKVIDTFTGLLIKHHAYFMPVEQIKEHLQEHFTLLNIIRVYANDDKEAKAGRYRDIINVGEEIKLYARHIGYDAILPYVYGLGKVYPEASIKELETPLGLKSSNQEDREQHQKKYRFRGDIHTYFNLKILTGCLYRLQEDKAIPKDKKTQIMENLNKIGAAVGRKVVKNYKDNKEVYTSWTADGKNRERNGWGQIVAALFLRWV